MTGTALLRVSGAGSATVVYAMVAGQPRNAGLAAGDFIEGKLTANGDVLLAAMTAGSANLHTDDGLSMPITLTRMSASQATFRATGRARAS